MGRDSYAKALGYKDRADYSAKMKAARANAKYSCEMIAKAQQAERAKGTR
jgi:hypothetical protein